MMIREMRLEDIAACADILCSVYNNEMWQRRGYGSMLLGKVEEYIKERGLAGITLSTNRYAPAPKFYQKNGFVDCEHVLFMCKEM